MAFDNPWPVDEEVIPTSWSELLEKLLGRNTEHLIYRGQRRYHWPLVCTLSRAIRDRASEGGGPIDLAAMESMVRNRPFDEYVRSVEAKLLRNFMQQAAGTGVPYLPAPEDRLGWWELMQHHGAPTRLLDWTRSPFIGLWFAFWGHNDGDGDVALWIFDTANSWINNTDAFRPEPVGWAEFLDDRQWQNRLAEDVITRQAFVPLVVSPRVTVPRVVAQESVLTLIPNIEAPQHFAQFLFKKVSTKIRVAEAWKPEVNKLCSGFGITRLSMFRDLDSIGDSLATALSQGLPFTPPDSALQRFVDTAATEPKVPPR